MAHGGKVLIIGAGGRMGAALARRYARSREVTGWRHQDCDVLFPDRVRDAVGRQDFEVLIYTAGITNVDQCETHPAEAALCNTETPRVLAEVCAGRGARFVHVSTDYVFKGDDPAPRKESDPAEPINVYGRTKLEGEKAVLAVSPDFLVLRVSWLFGPDRASFPDMILKRAMESDHVEAIADKHSCPTYSEDLAAWIEPLLDDPRARGILHLSNSGTSSWQAYGQAVLDLAAKTGFQLRTRVVQPISRLTFPGFKAARPEFTAFDTAKFQELTGITPRPWGQALEAYLRDKFARR
jgi:dTDP-4-dehydrorhamnose reductase